MPLQVTNVRIFIFTFMAAACEEGRRYVFNKRGVALQHSDVTSWLRTRLPFFLLSSHIGRHCLLYVSEKTSVQTLTKPESESLAWVRPSAFP